jgi:hypothetical protein
MLLKIARSSFLIDSTLCIYIIRCINFKWIIFILFEIKKKKKKKSNSEHVWVTLGPISIHKCRNDVQIQQPTNSSLGRNHIIFWNERNFKSLPFILSIKTNICSMWFYFKQYIKGAHNSNMLIKKTYENYMF